MRGKPFTRLGETGRRRGNSGQTEAWQRTAELGQALIRHLGGLHANGADLPSPDNLETWASAWEDAGQGIGAFRLSLRLFRTGVDFLKDGGTDRGILLDLNQEERKLLEQAFGLDGES